MKNKKVLFLAILILAVITLLIWLKSATLKIQNPDNKPQPGRQYAALPSDYNQRIKGEVATNDLIKKLPYKGQNFTLSYDFKTDEYILELNKSNLQNANTEFDQYLKTNGINSRDYLKNLVIK